MSEEVTKNPKRNVKKGKKSQSKFIFLILIFVIAIVGIIFLGKYIKNLQGKKAFLDTIHEDVDLTSKETSYYNLLLSAMNDHEDLVKGAEHVYFNLYDLPILTHVERENIAKKVLHSFEIHKDKELLVDTFDGLYFRGILNQETSELKDGIYVSFEDLDRDSELKERRFEISIYKNSDLNPTLIYNVKLDADNKITNYTKVSDLMPNENIEKTEE